MADPIQQLLDEHEIQRVLHTYIRGIDRLDAEAIRSAFHPDAIDHHGSFEGGPESYLEYVFPALETFDRTIHYVTNVQVDFESEDIAHTEAYLLAIHLRSPEENSRIDWFGGRYVDRFERREGRWRIAERTVVHDWHDSQTTSEVSAWRGRFVQGCRGPEDAVYNANRQRRS